MDLENWDDLDPQYRFFSTVVDTCLHCTHAYTHEDFVFNSFPKASYSEIFRVAYILSHGFHRLQ
jgi:hypothetical protein